MTLLDTISSAVASAYACALLAACQMPMPNNGTPIRQPSGPSVSSPLPQPPASSAGDGGFFEAIENTDPVLFVDGVRGPIGVLIPRGPAVYLNGALQRGPVSVSSGTRLTTGPGSLATVNFYAPQASACRVRIRDLAKGQIRGFTRSCVHEVDTRTDAGIGNQGGTRYSIGVIGGATQVAVLQGSAFVWLLSNPANRVVVSAGQKVFVRAGVLGRPTPSSPIGKSRESTLSAVHPSQSSPAVEERNNCEYERIICE